MIKLIKNFNKKQVLYIFIAFLLIAVQVYFELKIPDYMSKITSLVQTGGLVKDVLIQGFYMLGCALVSLASTVIVGYILANTCSLFSKNLRSKLYKKVESFSMSEIKSFSTSSLITRTTNDITNVEMFLTMGLQTMIKAPLTAIWAILKILGKSYTWTMITGGCVVVLLVTVISVMLTVIPRFKIVQKLIDRVNELTRENLKGLRVVRAFNAEDYQKDKFESVNDNLTKTQVFNQKIMGLISPMMYLVMNGVALAIYFAGAYLIKDATLSLKIDLFSNMVIFSSYATQVIMSFLMLAMIFIMLPRAQISAVRINEVLETENSIKEGNVTTSKTKGEVEFKNVSFKYPDAKEHMLENISFKANKGETIAIIGSTGSGKSTLINLITRFYDVTEGEVLIDGINIKNYKLNSLYDKIGYIPQKAVLFSGTISDNIAFGEKSNYKVTDKKIKEAVEVAQAKEFVENKEDKYLSNVAQGGSNLSGGQKQRLAIARAIARDPEIYIFDDSFSALDYKTDYTLRKELKKYTKDSTCFIVAQRIGTIKNADKIIVLDNGKCVGIGTHKELLKKCKVYKEIATSQLSEEELLNDRA